MRKLLPLLLLILAAVTSVACSDDAPTEPELTFELAAAFEGLYVPAEFEGDDVIRPCQITLDDRTRGGEPFAGSSYRLDWRAAWINLPGVTTSAGWPQDSSVTIDLPSDFGAGGLFAVELSATDSDGATDLASVSLRIDCEAGGEPQTFQGR
ncbi:MAG: hypothetical protein AAGM22_33655 [Acidobacteriota bacterium]